MLSKFRAGDAVGEHSTRICENSLLSVRPKDALHVIPSGFSCLSVLMLTVPQGPDGPSCDIQFGVCPFVLNCILEWELNALQVPIFRSVDTSITRRTVFKLTFAQASTTALATA
jgi:hypothetical protein